MDMTQTETRTSAGFERLYQLARKAAVEAAGGQRAFDLIGASYCAALIRSEALILIANQAEEVNPSRMLEFARYVAMRTTRGD